MRVSKLEFTDTPRRIRFGFPERFIMLDNDGSLTDLGPNTWATYYYRHLDQPECTKSFYIHDGVVCDSTIQIRRIFIHAAMPVSLFLS